MKRLLLGMVFLTSIVVHISQTYADTNLETPVLSKVAACGKEDGSYPDRLEIVNYGKSDFATGYLKQEGVLYYIVSSWRFNRSQTERTLTRVTLYSYDCATQKIGYFPPNFMQRFPVEMKWQDAMWGDPRPVFDYNSQNTYGWHTFAMRVLQKEGNLFLLAVCARDNNCEWVGYFKRIVYDAKSGRTVTIPALLGPQYSAPDTGSYEWIYLDIVPGKIRIAEEYYTGDEPYPTARDIAGQYRILYEYSFATRKFKQVGREDGPFYYSEYNKPLFGMYEDRPPTK